MVGDDIARFRLEAASSHIERMWGFILSMIKESY